jgi:tetratricopeptide (TPR) repeat protein
VRKAAGDLDDALADLNEVLRLDPNLGEAYSERARVWEARREPALAVADLTKAIDLLDREQRPAAVGEPRQPMPTDESKFAPHVIRLFQQPPEMSYNRRAAFLQQMDKWDAALADVEIVLGLSPDNVDARLLRALIWREKGLTHKAVDECTTVLKTILDWPRRIKFAVARMVKRRIIWTR